MNYATANGTATAPAATTRRSPPRTLTFTPGQTSKTVTVAVNGDTLDEANETFTVNLSAATNATIADAQGVGTIIDDDPTPSLARNESAAKQDDRDRLVVRGLGGSVTSLILPGVRRDAIGPLIKASLGVSGARPANQYRYRWRIHLGPQEATDSPPQHALSPPAPD